MLSVLIYPVCALMFVLCVWLVNRQSRQGASEFKIIMTGAVMGSLTFALQYVPPPHWLMADFEKAYYPAGEAVLRGDHAALTELLAQGVYGFVNLPIVAFVFAPFALLPRLVSGMVFLALGLWASVWVWRELVRYGDLNPQSSALILFLMIGSGPAGYGVVNGNTSQMVMIAVMWGVVAMMRGKDWTAGILFAMAALIKPALLVLGIYAFLRGRWKVSLAGGSVCAVAALLSIAVFGLPMHQLWLDQTIFPALQGATLAHNVQSIGGFIGRLFVGGAYLNNWDAHPIPAAASVLIKIAQIVVAVTIVASIVWLARKAQPQKTLALEVAFLMMALVVLPNLSWNHYYVWAFLPLALLLSSGQALDFKNRESALILIAAAMIAQPVYMWESGIGWVDSVFARLIVSLPFLGAVLLLGLMVRRVIAWDRLSDPGRFKLGAGDKARPYALTTLPAFVKLPYLTRRSDLE